MHGFERVDDRQSQTKKGLDRQGTPANHRFERPAFQQLHGNKALAILLSDVIDRANIRMAQRRSRFSLAPETTDGLWIVSNIIGQEVEGHKAMQAHVLGLVNDAHASAAKFFHNAVVRDGLADHSYVT